MMGMRLRSLRGSAPRSGTRQFRHLDVERMRAKFVRGSCASASWPDLAVIQLLSKRLEYRLQGEQATGLVVYKEMLTVSCTVWTFFFRIAKRQLRIMSEMPC